MSTVYRETISDERLKAVTDHVRAPGCFRGRTRRRPKHEEAGLAFPTPPRVDAGDIYSRRAAGVANLVAKRRPARRAVPHPAPRCRPGRRRDEGGLHV